MVCTRADPTIKNVAPYVMTSDNVDYHGTQIQGFILGATAQLADILHLSMHTGRFISTLDSTEYYCIVGHKIAQTMKDASARNIIGAQLFVGKQYYTVIDELNPTSENLFIFVDLNRSILISLQNTIAAKSKSYINNIIFKVANENDIGVVNPQVTAKINAVYPGVRLFFRSPQEIINSMQKQSQTFNLLLGFIGSIALVVGGIGVMNIMLVSVIERKKEIGIRLAVGARASDIQYMFLTEAVVLTLFGGVLGVLLGELIALFTAEVSGWTFHFYIMPPVVGFLVSAVIGMFFGFYPAKKAAQLDPIESLRSD